MAASQSILDALNSLEDNLVEAQSFADVCVDLAGSDQGAPSWPFLVLQQVDRIRAASQRLEALIRQQALPLLRDMEAVTGKDRANGVPPGPASARVHAPL